MNKKILLIIVILFVCLIIFILLKVGDGGDIKYSEEEIRCCTHCLSYGETNLTRDCLEVIVEHGGDMHCSLTMPNHPHTLFLNAKKL